MNTTPLSPTPPKPPRAKPKARPRDQYNPALALAVHHIGSVKALAKVCGVQVSASWRWIERGSLPRTEWTGETHYAELIEEAVQGKVTKAALLSVKPIRRRSLPRPDAPPAAE